MKKPSKTKTKTEVLQLLEELRLRLEQKLDLPETTGKMRERYKGEIKLIRAVAADVKKGTFAGARYLLEEDLHRLIAVCNFETRNGKHNSRAHQKSVDSLSDGDTRREGKKKTFALRDRKAVLAEFEKVFGVIDRIDHALSAIAL